MTIVPSGSPSWVRTNDLTHYGGDVNKQNYLSRGAIDSLTDVDAKQFSRIAADVASLARVAPFLTITLLCKDSVPGAPTIEFVNMQTGTNLLSYAGDSAPSGFPSAIRNGNGDVSVTLLSNYLDAYGVSGSFSISSLFPSLISSSAGLATAERVSDTVFRLRAFDSSGNALSNARMSCTVW